MAIYERHMSFSFLRGLICTLTPLALIIFAASMYFTFIEDQPLSDSFRFAIGKIKTYYREYPLYILSGHLFIFLATMAYRRKLINWWAQLTTIAGLSAACIFAYFTLNPEAIPTFHDPLAPTPRPDKQVKSAPPPSRPNLLRGTQPQQPTTGVLLSPDAQGAHSVTASFRSTSFSFTIAPQYDITTIAYERLQEFSSLPCTPIQYTTSNGLVYACSMTIPELNIAGIRAFHVPVVFVSTVLNTSFMGRDLLTTIGYRRDGQNVFLGKLPA